MHPDLLPLLVSRVIPKLTDQVDYGNKRAILTRQVGETLKVMGFDCLPVRRGMRLKGAGFWPFSNKATKTVWAIKHGGLVFDLYNTTGWDGVQAKHQTDKPKDRVEWASEEEGVFSLPKMACPTIQKFLQEEIYLLDQEELLSALPIDQGVCSKPKKM